jgi:hypothetical protein
MKNYMKKKIGKKFFWKRIRHPKEGHLNSHCADLHLAISISKLMMIAHDFNLFLGSTLKREYNCLALEEYFIPKSTRVETANV